MAEIIRPGKGVDNPKLRSIHDLKEQAYALNGASSESLFEFACAYTHFELHPTDPLAKARFEEALARLGISLFDGEPLLK